MMKLIEPSVEYEQQIRAYRQEFLDCGDSMDGTGALRRMEDPRDWIEFSIRGKDPLTAPPDRVPATQYMFVREADRKIVGMLQIRHRFNAYLEKYGGHIGYSVAPSERRKGYASQMLALALPKCRELGIDKALITCVRGNEGSKRTILRNGGVYESTVREPGEGIDLERYWIDLTGPELRLHVPRPEDGWFHRQMMTDPATMAYNAPWFPPDGCVPDPEAEWDDLQTNWIGNAPLRFYAFLQRTSDGAFVGDVNYHRAPGQDACDMGIVIYAPERGKGYGRQGLALLLDRAFRVDGVPCLRNDFETARGAAYRIHRAVGFRETGTEDGVVHLELTREEYLAARQSAKEKKPVYEIQPLTEEESSAIEKKVGEYAHSMAPSEPHTEEERLVFKAEDGGNVVGGCVVNVHEWGRAVLAALWVDERYRGQGLGSMLIKAAERAAREKGCYYLCLGTFDYQARPLYEKHGFTVFTTTKDYPPGHEGWSLSKRLDRETPDYVPVNNSAADRFEIRPGTKEDAEIVTAGLERHCDLFVQDEHEDIEWNRKLVDRDGRLVAGVVSDVAGWGDGFITAIWVEEPYRGQGLGSRLLREAEREMKENGAYVVLTNTCDWNTGFFEKNGYVVRGELTDYPKGHSAYELEKRI